MSNLTKPIEISRLARDEGARVEHLKLQPGQEAFVGLPQAMLSDPSPNVDCFAVESEGMVVGFFKIDRDHGLARPGELGLRGVMIDGSLQGQGYAGSMLSALPEFIRAEYPFATGMVLTVNLSNPGAIKAYRNRGWVDEGEMYFGGRSGPQHVLRLPL